MIVPDEFGSALLRPDMLTKFRGHLCFPMSVSMNVCPCRSAAGVFCVKCKNVIVFVRDTAGQINGAGMCVHYAAMMEDQSPIKHWWGMYGEGEIVGLWRIP